MSEDDIFFSFLKMAGMGSLHEFLRTEIVSSHSAFVVYYKTKKLFFFKIHV